MESRDRWSGLPDHLLLVILSLLPVKSAVVTAILSRRWRWLWTDLPNIDISIDYDFCNHRGEFFTLLDNLLPKFTSPFIHRFSLDLGCYLDDGLFMDRNRNYSHIISWLDWACRRKFQVQELSFKLTGRGGSYPDAFPDHPMWVFQIPSIVVLELRPWLFVHEDYHDPHALFRLPNLKKLCVDLYAMNPRVLEKLVSSCPSLEVLSFSAVFVGNASHTVNLSSPSLKRLDINLSSPMVSVVINAPNLEYLGIHVDSFDELVPYWVSFVNPPTALLASSIWAWSQYLDDMFVPSNLLNVIANVTSLTIIDKKPSSLIAPITFSRLTHLQLRLCTDLNEVALFPGLALLKQCPVLEVLTIDLTKCLLLEQRNWSLPDSTPQCLVTCVKRIKIVAHAFVDGLENSLLHLVKYLLGTAKALELLRINIIAPPPHFVDGRYDESHLIEELFKVPRSSPHCPIEFYGLYHRESGGDIKSAPSTGYL